MAEIDEILENLLSGEKQKKDKTPQKIEDILIGILSRLIFGGFGAICLILLTLASAYLIRRQLIKYRTYSTNMEILLVNEKDGGRNGNVSSEIIGGITGWNTTNNKLDEIKIMSSRPVVSKMLKDTHLIDSAYVFQTKIKGTSLSYDDSLTLLDFKVDAYRKAVQFSIEETDTRSSSSIIKLKINGYQGTSKLILNGMVEAYNDYTREYRNQCYEKTISFLSYCIDSIRNEINQLDLFEENFSEDNFVIDLDLQNSVYLNTDRDNEKEIAHLQLQRQLLSIIRNYMVDMGQDYKIVPANTGIDDSQINTIVLQFNDLVMRRSNYMTSMGEDAMRVQTINNQIEDQRQAIIVSISKLAEALDIRLSKYEQNYQESNDRLMELPRKQLVMAYIKRERDIIVPLYNLLQQKKTETLIAKAGEQDQARIISPPYIIESLLFTKSKIFFMITFSIAFALAFLYLWKLHLPDLGLQVGDILSRAQLPIWGVIPTAPKEVTLDDEWRKPDRKGNDSLLNFDSSLRSLLTQVEMKGAKAIVITSGYKHDGKTFITHQLANLFIDRKIPFDVLDWKSEPNVKQLICDYKQRRSQEEENSYLLIDAGSYHENPDLPILSREADATLYCLRAEHSEFESLEFSNYLVDQKLIFNGAVVVAQAEIEQQQAVNFGSFDYKVPSGFGVVLALFNKKHNK